MIPRITALLLFATSCTHAPAAPQTPGAINILFIGNSLTYTNDLPGVLRQVAASKGTTIHTESIAGPNLAIIDHLNGATDALQRVQSRQWDFVILQQGPTTTPIGRDSLIIWTKLWDPHIRKAGARPALLMTWTPRAQLNRMDLVRLSYKDAADAVDGVFIPAGDAWTAALHKGVEVYGPDNFHPSRAGTEVVARSIYETLTVSK